MQIKIENFGPIKSFDFDLDKDFHVIYGKNNIGKSYAISLVYIILKSFLNLKKDLQNVQFLLQHINSDPTRRIYELSQQLNERLEENPNLESISMKSDFQNIIKDLIESTFLSDLKESFKNSFSQANNTQNRLTKDPFKIVIRFNQLTLNINLNEKGDIVIHSLEYAKKCTIKFVKTNRQTKLTDNELRFYINKIELDKSLDEFRNSLNGGAFGLVFGLGVEISKYIDDIFFLPASRSGLYEAMNIFSSVFARLAQLRHLVNDKIDIPSLSDPMSDYFLNLSTIELKKGQDIYAKFATNIEKDILNAEISFNEENKKLEYFNSKTKLKLDLSETSSMVSEIAPIVAYLKYIINEDNEKPTNGIRVSIQEKDEVPKIKPSKVIFIEEPEAHLHPEIQVKLTNIFIQLIKHNIKIILTTHSNYIFNKVNNLILANELSTEKIANYHIVQTDEGSIVKNEENLTDAGITDENFADVAQKLYNERLEILHQD